ncbi:MAG TPA: hypothetical protein PKY78_02020 [Candidatus Omnitrophota bacterium]|nr:hypothetical protein [Candidatus Omnitrophota bacterium]
MNKFLSLVVLVGYFVCSMAVSAPAQETPDTLKEKALEKIDLAKEFSERAKKVLGSPTKDNIKIARYLFMEAGNLYEQARAAFEVLAKNYYIGRDYVDGAQSAVNGCVDAVNQCTKRLNEMENR